MQKHFPSFFIFGICLVLLFAPAFRCQTLIPIPYSENFANSQGQVKYYSIDISNMPQDVDISISTQKSGTGAVTRIFASKTNKDPNSPQTSDWNSQNALGNVRVIKNNELKDAKTLYFGLQCSANQCDTKLRVDYSRELNLHTDGYRIVQNAATLGGISSAVVRLGVPLTLDVDRIFIHIDAIPSEADEIPTLEVFLKKGRDVPSNDDSGKDSVAKASWFAGRTIVISRNSELFCVECEYTMMLFFNQNAMFSIGAGLFFTETEIDGSNFLDGVSKESQNLYLLKVPEERKELDIVVDLRTHIGSPIVYLNCDERPSGIERYYWKYNIDKSQEIVLTARERAQCKTNSWFISVYGDEMAVYSIKVSVKEERLFIGKESQILGDIFPGEKISYEIFTPLFSNEKIIVRLDTKGTIDVNIVNCRFPSDCPGLLPGNTEYKHQDTTGANFELKEFKYETVNTKTGRNFIIDTHASGCYPILIQDPGYMEDAIPVCAYQITLSASSNEYYPQEYTLYADSQAHKWMFPGIPAASSVIEGDTDYFLVNIPAHKDMAAVKFQLTEFSGDVDIWISKTEKYPNEESDDTMFAHEGMIIFNETNTKVLNGSYYVAIKALTTSSFALSVVIVGKDQAKEDYALRLDPGVPQRGVLLPNNEYPAQFYKFKLNLKEGWKGTVKISVSTLRGNVLVAVNNDGKLPLPNLHQWKSGGNELEIRSDDSLFDPKGTYYIGVFVDWTYMTVDDIVFTISFNVKEEIGTDIEIVTHQHQFLSPNIPFFGKLKPGQVEYFEAFVLPNDKKIIIFKQADMGDVDLYLSIDPRNLYPSADAYTYTTKNTQRDFIELNRTDFLTICRGDENTYLCSFYFTVIPKASDYEVSYQLTMFRDSGKDDTYTSLEDGKTFRGDAPSDSSKPELFYFYTTPSNPGVITVSCPGKIPVIYALKSAVEIGTSAKPDLNTPTPDEYQYSSDESRGSLPGSASLVIPAKDLEQNYVIAVAVYFYDLDPPVLNSGISRYSIMASTQLNYLFIGKPLQGFVEKNKYTYFVFDVARPSATLLLSLTTLDEGDPDLVVSIGYGSRPTIEEAQFSSISDKRTELLEISEVDVYPKTSMDGTWVVGVFGRKASTFTLTVTYEDQKMVELIAGQPFETYLKGDATIYFKYYHAHASELEIRVDSLSGDLDAFVSTVKSGEDVAAKLPNATDFMWKFKPKSGETLNIAETDSLNCVDCVYLIGVTSKSGGKFSTSITEGGQFTQIQNSIPYTANLEGESVKKYFFASSDASDLRLSLSMVGQRLDVYVSHNPTVNSTNYVWKSELTPSEPSKVLQLQKSDYEDYMKKTDANRKGIWDGKKNVLSEDNNFYLYFENPFYSNTKYTFSLSVDNAPPVLKHGSKNGLTIPAESKTNAIFYSSEEEEIIKINLQFKISRDFNDGPDADFEKFLKRGLGLRVFYWGEKSTVGNGEQVALLKQFVLIDNVVEKGSVKEYSVRQAYTTSSKRGKFHFEIQNPFFAPADVQVTAYSTEYGTLNIEPNSEFGSTLSEGISETFEVYLGETGAWYFFVQTCAGTLDFSLEDNPDKLATGSMNTQEIIWGSGAMKQIQIKEPKTEWVYVGRSSQSQGDAQFIFSSSFFRGEQIRSYETAYYPLFQKDFTFSPFNSVVTLSIPAIQVAEADEKDVVNYRVKVCPNTKSRKSQEMLNLCKIYEDCRTTEVSDRINSGNVLTAKVDKLVPGDYYIQVTADIQHQGKLVKVVPYEVELLTIQKRVGERISEMLTSILIGLAVLIFGGIICFKCYKRMKKISADRGFELPNIRGKREYEILGDDI